MTDRVRIGVAGAGVFGAYHAEKFAARGDAVVTSIYDIDSTRAESLASCCGAKPYKDYAKFLDNIDAVIIATPATDHFGLAEEALNNGRHLLVEKPLALSVDQADTLIALAASNKLVLQVGHQERYVCAAAGLFVSPEKPYRIECVRRVPRTGRCEDVSVVFDLMVHDIDIVRQLARSEICSLRAEGDKDEISAEIILENGVVVSLLASRRARESERRMTIGYGDRLVDFDFIDRTIAAPIPTGPETLALDDPLAYGAALFVAAIRGEPSGYVTGVDARDCIDWAVRVEEAAGFLARPAVDVRERLRA